MPSLRLFLVRLFPVLGGSSHNTSGYQNYGEEYGNKSGVLRSRSKTLVETGKPPSQPEHNGIELQKMFVVRYGDEDEASLVRVREAEGVGKSSRSANSTSEVSL